MRLEELHRHDGRLESMRLERLYLRSRLDERFVLARHPREERLDFHVRRLRLLGAAHALAERFEICNALAGRLRERRRRRSVVDETKLDVRRQLDRWIVCRNFAE